MDSSDIEWVTIVLQTITPKHRDFRQISISMFYLSIFVLLGAETAIREVEEQTIEQWLELDRLLVQLWEPYSIPPKILCCAGETAHDLIGRLLPETTGGGTVNLFDDW